MVKKSKQHQRNRMYWRIVWAVSLFAVLWVAVHIREPSLPAAQPSITQAGIPEQVNNKAGYEQFVFEDQNIVLQIPNQQAPLRAAGGDDKNQLLYSQDFTIGLHRAAEFTFDVWDDESVVCTYDGATQQFTGTCKLGTYQQHSTTVYFGEFSKGATTRLVTIAPLQHRQYFFSSANDVKEVCDQSNKVCDARLLHQRQKLIKFTADIIDANHTLFAR